MREFIKYKILIKQYCKKYISRLIENILRLKIKIKRQKIMSYIYQKQKKEAKQDIAYILYDQVMILSGLTQ